MFGWKDKTGVTAWAAALKASTSITELSLAKNNMRADDAKILADDIRDNGALTKLDMSDNRLATNAAGEALGEMLKANTTLLELDVSKNEGVGARDGPGFAKGMCKGLADNGAISSVNLLKNNIPVEQAQELVKIMQSKEKLITLCGLSKEETELDLSGQRLRAGDAVLIANDISNMRALSTLIFGGETYSNSAAGGLYRGCTWQEDASTGYNDVTPVPATLEVGMTEADFSNKNLGPGSATIISAWISHKDNGALIKLDISNNYIEAGQKRGLQRFCVASGIDVAM
jgi:hypothetical protein